MKKRRKLPYLGIILLILYVIYFNLKTSVFFRGDDKINIVFYGQISRFYSIDPKGLDYFLTFPPDAKVVVPGGYGQYRIGALNKLAALEKKPDIIKKAFSNATSSMVDLYFYPAAISIFYKLEDQSSFSPRLAEIFFNPGSANPVDRFLIMVSLLGKSKNSYKEIKLNNDFDKEKFAAENMGVFYSRKFRGSRQNVQIIYENSYNTALIVSQILDGEGIRVVDISREAAAKPVRCQVVTARENLDSDTALAIRNFLGCDLKAGTTTVSDIILKLGIAEKEWSAM